MATSILSLEQFLPSYISSNSSIYVPAFLQDCLVLEMFFNYRGH